MNALTQTYAQRAFLSIMMACIGFAMFSVADACVKYFGQQGYNTYIIQFYSSMVGTSLSAIYILCHKRSFNAFFPKKSKIIHLLRVISLAIGVNFLIEALQLLQMAEFYAVMFLVPFLVALGTAFCFGEHVGIWRWISIIGGFCGVLIAVSGSLSDPVNVPIQGILYAFVMVICLTLSYLFIRQIGHGEYPPLFPLYAQGAISLFSFVIILTNDIPFPMPQLYEMPIWLLYGICIFGAVMLVSTAFTTAPVTAIPAPFQYSQILWGVLFGYFIFDETPKDETMIGLYVIIASGLFMVWREYKTARYSMEDIHDH